MIFQDLCIIEKGVQIHMMSMKEIKDYLINDMSSQGH